MALALRVKTIEGEEFYGGVGGGRDFGDHIIFERVDVLTRRVGSGDVHDPDRVDVEAK